MFGIGIAFYYSFSVTKYKGEGAPSFAPPVPRAQKRRFFSSIASVANMKDVFRDTVNSIARAPQVYVHIAGKLQSNVKNMKLFRFRNVMNVSNTIDLLILVYVGLIS
jgi:hypothetical protein